jgi:SAM-dependent methyltransferase
MHSEPPRMNPHAALDAPSEWVARFAPLIPLIPAGEVLDLACGAGRHARLLAARGNKVLAVDRDSGLLAQAAGAGIETLRVDLECDPPDGSIASLFREGRFSGIVVTNYLHRPLFPQLLSSLAPGGVFIYETFAQGNGRFGKPSNPVFLLQPGELLQILLARSNDSMRIVAFEDGYLDRPWPAMVQRICAIRTEGAMEAAALRLS